MTKEEVKRARQELGLTQAELAHRLCITVRAVGHYEAGTRNLSRRTERDLRSLLSSLHRKEHPVRE